MHSKHTKMLFRHVLTWLLLLSYIQLDVFGVYFCCSKQHSIIRVSIAFGLVGLVFFFRSFICAFVITIMFVFINKTTTEMCCWCCSLLEMLCAFSMEKFFSHCSLVNSVVFIFFLVCYNFSLLFDENNRICGDALYLRSIYKMPTHRHNQSLK